MDKIFEQAMLYDFYGELLNEHQKSVYEDYVLNNLSLSEIAQEQGISRQAVHDMIKRSEKALTEYENKLQLIKRFLAIKEKVNSINAIADELSQTDATHSESIKTCVKEMMEEL